ncbi:MAG TPA: HPP family protein [Longimicrobium sp.]|uniref:HPP family protein n=1 Tax=Longimicrobium sp. TaxID=2029185 RepID=UPI002ED7D308
MTEKESLAPGGGEQRAARRRLPLRGELALAALPTATVLLVLLLVQMLTEQRLLFASLASSAFLIYMDPEHGTNRVRTLLIAQMSAASLGLAGFLAFGPGYPAAALAMTATILLMIVTDAVHPPAVSTALSFSLRAGPESNLALFALAVGITAVLVVLQRAAVWTLARHAARR